MCWTALRRRVEAGDGHEVELARLLRRDHRVGEGVVGGDDAVDLVARLLQHLLEDRQRLLPVPVRDRLLGDQLVVAGVELGLQDLLVALLEVGRERVGRRAVQLRDRRLGLAGLVEPVDQALALQPARLGGVAGHVVVGVALQRQAVVVDHRHALRLRGRDDRRATPGVEVDEQDHLRALGDRLLGLAALRRRVALRVVDDEVVVGEPGRLERLAEEAPVGVLPAVGRLAVGQQDGDLAAQLLAATAPAARVRRAVIAAARGRAERQHRRENHSKCPAHEDLPVRLCQPGKDS